MFTEKKLKIERAKERSNKHLCTYEDEKLHMFSFINIP